MILKKNYGFIITLIVLNVLAVNVQAEEVLAKVGSEKITEQDLEYKLRSFPQKFQEFYSTDSGRDVLLKQLIKERMFYLEAKKKNYLEDKEVQAMLKNIERELMVNKYIIDFFDSIEISDDMIKNYYQKHKGSYKKVKASHILVKTKGEADKIAIEARKKDADFAALAKKHSTGPSASKGGDLGWFGQGAMVPEFEKAAFSLKKGEVSEPVKTSFGWHLIKVYDLQDPDNYKQVATEIRKQMLELEKTSKLEEKYQQLSDNYEVEIFEE